MTSPGNGGFTVKEAAEKLGVDYRTILGYLREGDLKGKKVRVSPKRLEWRIPKLKVREQPLG